MRISILLFLCALALSGTAAYYSIAGLATIFSGAFWPVVIMAGILELSKLVVASWLYQKWDTIPFILKTYLTGAVIVLMFITSLGIFGFLSKSHVESGLASQDITIKLEQIDAQIVQNREIITRYQSQLTQLDKSINLQLDANRATAALTARKQQESERNDIKAKLDNQQKTLESLLGEKTSLRQQLSIIESKVGPIKYIAEFFADGQMIDLDRAVRWVIVIIVLVFDPLAILMLIAANINYVKERQPLPKLAEYQPDKPEPKQAALTIGQTLYNPVNNSTVWWTGSEWAALPTPVKEPTDLQEKIVIQPEIKVYPPNIDTEIIKTVVASSMDSWLDTASVKTNTTQPFAEQEKNSVVEPETEKTIEEPIDELPDSSYTNTEDTFHPQEHFKPTHITYGRRV
jgi:hypothetical protein